MSARQRALALTSLPALVTALLAAACLDRGVYRCSDDSHCGTADQAFCETTGYCSFRVATSACGSGRRYSAHAGGGLAGHCVEDACQPDPVLELRAGARHACVVRASGAVACWGDGSAGQLGVPSTTEDGGPNDGDQPARFPRAVPLPVKGAADVVEVALGDRHTCARVAAGRRREVPGRVLCWGDNGSGQLGNGSPISSAAPVAVAGLEDAVALAAGASFTCAVRADATVVCWGSNADGELGIPDEPDPQPAPRAVPGLDRAVTLGARHRHACAVREDGGVWCWGGNSHGELGRGDGSAPSGPGPVLGLGASAITAVAAGMAHTCARGGGKVYCWGSNESGQLGTEGGAGAAQASPVAALSDVVDVTAGDLHTCVGLAGGEVRCWGANHNGQLGEGTTTAHQVPVPVTDVADSAELAAGGAFSCARRTTGALTCWGDNRLGQLALGGAVDQLRPVRVSDLATAVSITAGAAHTCARRTGATDTVCWGGNQAGQLGDGTRVDRPAPVLPKVPLGARELVAGGAHNCLRGGDRSVWCWGGGSSGQLGSPGTSDLLVPASVAAAGNAVRIGAGAAHSCAIQTDGRVLCWGSNDHGQLGDGVVAGPDGPGRAEPRPVVGLGDAVEVALGAAHSCARVAGGLVACWGRGDEGQLGDDRGTTSPTPVAVGGLTGAVALTAGDRHSCAVSAAGEVLCWGDGRYGQLGWDSTARHDIPTLVRGLRERALFAVGAAAGARHTCARVLPSNAGATTPGAVYCWGDNASGQLGDGTRTPRLEPADPVIGIGDAIELAAGADHTCALRASGAVSCWGSDRAGQLGDGVALQRTTPQPARLSCP